MPRNGVAQPEFKRQVGLPVSYKGVQLDCGYRLDLLVGGEVVVELKSVDGSNQSMWPNC